MLPEEIWCFIGNRWLCEAFCLSRGGEVDSNDFWTPWMHMVDTGINTSGPQLSSHDLIGQGVCVYLYWSFVFF